MYKLGPKMANYHLFPKGVRNHGNKARATCFASMLLALFQVKTVNLTAIATAFDSPLMISSRYKSVQRFFRYFVIDYTIIARFIFRMFFENHTSFYLVMDRTNWKFGQADINILMLSIAFRGVAIPILWRNLARAGNSSTPQSIAIVSRFIHLFGVTRIAGLLADREFIGKNWFKYRAQESITVH